ncbi:ElyC/SanA/YdcF family protein [Danxiaibacter flavus]|uniref:ElyC/SanA/YdcF family protein n=1 Tax=Danxiaibacter flavus TaxID=3049108 RepID=A0ABV3ZDU2_9BACT|nr:ElyC/SanA/YdcF family protein [Chitinophagaceae bacterium DXS]
MKVFQPLLTFKAGWKIILSLAIMIFTAIFICDRKIKRNAEGKIYTDVNKIPFHKTGILLGTAKFLSNGNLNPYYIYRINAAVDLLRHQKIKYIIVSGDNGRNDYNEPDLMRTDLIQAGIDSTLIYEDFAGFRTFDSIVRLREIFGQHDVTIISQPFHNERALYIASKENINAIAFNAKDVAGTWGLKTQIREKLARVKVFSDYIFGKSPKYLGKPVTIE